MSLRIRKDGRILCAKYHKEEMGDLYINDKLHEWLNGCDERKLKYSTPLKFYNPKTHEWFFVNPENENKDIINITKQCIDDDDGIVKYFKEEMI